MRVDAGDPLDDVVLRSYAIGATHMALGWVLTEGLAVDPETGEVLDLTIRSFGIIRAKDDAAGRRRRSSTIGGPPRALGVGRGVRGGCGGRVERGDARRRRAPGGVPRGRHARRPYAAPVTVEPVPTPSAPPVAGPYSPAVRAGDWLVLAGQVPLDPTTGHFVDGDAARADPAGARQHRRGARATAARSSPTSPRPRCSSPTSATSRAMNEVYGDFFGDHRPARSTVQVAALPGGAKVEIEAWAYVPHRSGPGLR